jgi:hypothetical protein
MPFEVTQAMVDVIKKTAFVTAVDTAQGPVRIIQMSFPFDPPAEAAEKDRLIDAAKQIVQQALRDI